MRKWLFMLKLVKSNEISIDVRFIHRKRFILRDECSCGDIDFE
jgi:hypothetical protein